MSIIREYLVFISNVLSSRFSDPRRNGGDQHWELLVGVYSDETRSCQRLWGVFPLVFEAVIQKVAMRSELDCDFRGQSVVWGLRSSNQLRTSRRCKWQASIKAD